MLSRTKLSLLGVVLFGFAVALHADPTTPVNCNCVTNLPALQTNACQGVVPDLCALATNCFSGNMLPDSTPPVAFTGLECLICEDMDNLIYDLQTTPACTPVPLNVVSSPGGISLSWEGDGFRLQGAETVAGPWYDLGDTSPVTLTTNHTLRLFRLTCD